MSTIAETSEFCAACGRRSKQGRLMSFSTFSGPDLDFRPAQMLRSTMRYWIMACPHCGYVAENISKWPRVMHVTLERLYEGANKSLPELAYLFHKRALHCAHLKDCRGAIRAYLCAAWVCDDAGDETRAKEMRVKCLEFTQRRMKNCKRSEWNHYAILMADLLRRTGALEGLFSIDCSDEHMEDATRRVIACQQQLARNNDFATHCCDEFDLEME